MFQFIRLKGQRRTFIQYLLSVTALFLIASLVIFQILLQSEAGKHAQYSNAFFSTVQSNLSRMVSSIDSYMTRLYANTKLLGDFLTYFSSNAEEYLSEKFDDMAQSMDSTSFLRDFKMFVRENDYLIKRVVFCGDSNTNMITFSSNGGADYTFNANLAQISLPQNDLSYGYLYTRTITSPDDFSKTIGTVIFVIDTPRIFSETDSTYLYNAAVVNEDSVYLFCPGNGILSAKKINELYAMPSVPENGFFSSVYYTALSSTQFSFKLITAASFSQMIRQNGMVFLLALFLLLVVYLLVMLLIVTRLESDARALHSILDFIETAESGEFHDIQFKNRRNEYAQIAAALTRMGRSIERHIDREYVLTLEEQKARMAALQNQINPHFLYNTLEIIRCRALINRDEEVSTAIENLGSLYRDIVKGDENISIGQELAILTHYLDLMQFRYPDHFIYQIDVPKEVCDAKTVKCWMQPIVENFFKHGFDRTNEFNLLMIEGEIDASGYLLRFTNNGAPIENSVLLEIQSWLSGDTPVQEKASGRLGLKNVYQRLHLLYGPDFCMQIENREEGGVLICVHIPSITEE